jgi:cation diffusion facilitator CzcD-associated flavoprotein CzcO
MEHLDVLVVGAGLSGVGAGHFLKTRCPDRSFAIFEAREAIGGTWDLFRYPGIRSDSDMFTLGYAFRPWTEAKAIADGPSILAYVKATAAEGGIDRHIRLRRRVTRASWDSATARWTVDFEEGEARRPSQITCGFLHMCAGYYSYECGYRPEFPGEDAFKGPIIHPQHWPEDLDYSGKRVVIIGSGATAVTLAPEMARQAAHVTVLQRSPTYVVSRPSEDAFANALRRKLPARLAYGVTRWRNVLGQIASYKVVRRYPERAKANLVAMVKDQLGPDYDVERHFTPSYNPWDQRICLVPDADLFKAIKTGTVAMVTQTIAGFVPDGIRLASGETLAADIVVSATGLNMQLMSGLTVVVDGRPIDFSQTFSYKGMMYSGTPNLSSTFGYTNASWTLKADLTAEYLCRLLNHMKAKGYVECRPVNDDPKMEARPWLDFSSGYVARALPLMPKQGAKAPWRVYQNYILDLLAFRYGPLEDGVMRYSKGASVSGEDRSASGLHLARA